MSCHGGVPLCWAVLFVLFYWILPLWIHTKLDDLQDNMFRPMLDAVFARRIHWLQWIGIALGLVGLFFAVRNYFTEYRMDRSDLWGVGWLARLFARFLD